MRRSPIRSDSLLSDGLWGAVYTEVKPPDSVKLREPRMPVRSNDTVIEVWSGMLDGWRVDRRVPSSVLLVLSMQWAYVIVVIAPAVVTVTVPLTSHGLVTVPSTRCGPVASAVSHGTEPGARLCSPAATAGMMSPSCELITPVEIRASAATDVALSSRSASGG